MKRNKLHATDFGRYYFALTQNLGSAFAYKLISEVKSSVASSRVSHRSLLRNDAHVHSYQKPREEASTGRCMGRLMHLRRPARHVAGGCVAWQRQAHSPSPHHPPRGICPCRSGTWTATSCTVPLSTVPAPRPPPRPPGCIKPLPCSYTWRAGRGSRGALPLGGRAGMLEGGVVGSVDGRGQCGGRREWWVSPLGASGERYLRFGARSSKSCGFFPFLGLGLRLIDVSTDCRSLPTVRLPADCGVLAAHGGGAV